MAEVTRRNFMLTAAAAGSAIGVAGSMSRPTLAQVPQYGPDINLEQAKRIIVPGRPRRKRTAGPWPSPSSTIMASWSRSRRWTTPRRRACRSPSTRPCPRLRTAAQPRRSRMASLQAEPACVRSISDVHPWWRVDRRSWSAAGSLAASASQASQRTRMAWLPRPPCLECRSPHGGRRHCRRWMGDACALPAMLARILGIRREPAGA